MNRRTFVTATGVAGLGSLGVMDAPASKREKQTADQQYLELRHYHALVGPKSDRLLSFLRDVAIPAWNRLGISPVGVFNVTYGPNAPSVYVLLPHPSLESITSTRAKLVEDAAYQEAGADFLNASLEDPAFVRMESRLMRAFRDMPVVQAPPGAASNEPRIFELRMYESHSEAAARRKVEMFNDGGEIAIFHKTGLTPVFFGETFIGSNMPNLTYMLTFKDMAERDRAWDAFRKDPDWASLSGDAYYRNTVSAITDFILRPTPFSQI